MSEPGFPYPWPRYWVERSRSSGLDGGFLAVPEGEYAWAHENRPRTMAELAETPMLVLLGEPGMGKSRSLVEEASRLETTVGSSGVVLYRNLNEYGSGESDRLRRDLFECDGFSRYREGARLHLLLDSLDECKLSLTTLATWLGNRFREYVAAPDRIHLRIACRNGAWPGVLESTLRELFPDRPNAMGVQVLELCPLRREDVATAARIRGADSEWFLEAVAAREIQPLAARPITLDFLLKLWLKGELPQSKVEIYRRGLETLCEEHNPERRAAGHIGTLTVQQRLRVAARIAASTMFCNRSAVWLGAGAPDSGGGIAVKDLTGRETADVGEFVVDDNTLKETVEIAGLFASRGEQQIAFAHQSYAEFLAAWYASQSRIAPERLLGLLLHQEDKTVVPQLVETAGWLAALDKHLFDLLVDHAPDILLTCDGAAMNDADRERLTAKLLKQCERPGLIARDFTPDQWRKLSHPGLASQLHAAITDRQQAVVVRDLALEIAKYCRLESLCDAAIALVLDGNEDPWLRITAALFVTKVGDASGLQSLRPLVLDGAESEPDRRLREIVLARLGLEYLSAEEFFAALTKTLRPHHVGQVHLLLLIRPGEV